MADDSDFPSKSKECHGRWVGVAEHCSHKITWKMLADDTCKFIHRSNVRPAASDAPNYHLDPLHGEDIIDPIIKSKSKDDFIVSGPDFNSESHQANTDPPEVIKKPSMPIVHPVDLVGCTFLKDPEEDGQCFHVQIVEALDEYKNGLNADPKHIQFCCSVNDDQYEEIMSYHDILEYID